MKNKIKIYRIALLCLLSLAMGCSKDDYQIDQQRKEPSSKLSFEQFKNETGLRDFKTSIQVQRKKNGALSRNADGSYELTDFDIDTDVIKKLLVNQKLSYTFMVRPKDKESTPDTFYNLTVYYEKGNWETLIVALKPNDKSLIDIKNGSMKDYEGTAQPVYNSNRTWVNTGCVTVTLVTAVHCTCDGSGCDGCTGGSFPCLEIQDFKFCDMMDTNSGVDYGGSPSGPSTPGTHTGGGGGGGGDNTPTTNNDDDTLGDDGPAPPKHVYVDPNIKYVPTPKTPCDELKKLNPNLSIQQTLRILKVQSSGQEEHGNYISVTTNSAGSTYLSFPVIPPDPDNPAKLNMDAGIANGNIKGAMHCHTDPATTNAVPMFSPEDLMRLFSIARNHNTNGGPKDYSEYTVMLSVGSGHYALKFKDFNSLFVNFNANFNDFDQNIRDSYTASTPTASSATLIKAFLKALIDNKFNGVGLYKATEITNSDGIVNITGWKEQALDASGNVYEIPCN